MSVIITSYNEAQYLPEAIESCLSQNFTDYEIIIGDDGSDDESIELIKEYCEKYPDKIKYFVMDRPKDDSEIIPSLRASNVIKTGIDRARGKFIVTLSADDYYCDNEKFSDAVKFLNSHEDYSAYVSGFKKVYPDGHEEVFDAVKWQGSIFWSGMYIHLASFTFRKSVYNDGYFPNRFCDDTGTIFAMACAGKWQFSDKITFAYRQRAGSIMYKSDKLELAIFELMLFQDCLNADRIRWSSYSRYYTPLRQVYQQRTELHNDKYTKYVRNCEEYDNNILGEILKSNTDIKSKIFVWYMLVRGKAASLFFRLCRAPRKIRRILRKALSR